ncbi:MAG: class A beta-lactamase-related serine hydrolase [Planctomycetota bacterium]|nr:MAG: class A beta-lactamase-related serine hydrolase [Planctomycetota bacterium]
MARNSTTWDWTLLLAAACLVVGAPSLIAGEPAEGKHDARRDKLAAALLEQMEQHGVPGVGVAVFNDYAIDWADGYGVLAIESDAGVTPETRFQAASISKPVAAAAALKLAEQGKLDLDAEVNDVLASWKVPEGANIAKMPIQVRQLLSHTAGLTVHGFPGYAVDAKRPTLIEILDGTPPANTGPIRPLIKPGYAFRYSGGGYTVLQQLLIDVTGQPFPELMQQAVLGPLEMTHSTYEQPLPAEWASQAASGHRPQKKPVAGKWHIYPEMAAAGLWTTPSDLARFAIDLSRCHAGEQGTLLSQQTAEEMLTAVRGNYGLGLAVQGEGETLRFSHGGANDGFRCLLMAYPATGQGIALMTNSDTGDRIFTDILKLAGQLYAWPKQ